MLDTNSSEYRRIAIAMDAELQNVYEQNVKFFKRIKHPYFSKLIDYQPKRLKLHLSAKGFINLYNTNTGQDVYPEDPCVYAEKQADSFIKKRPHYVITSSLPDRGQPNRPFTEYLTATNKKYNQLLPERIEADQLCSDQLFMYGAGLCLQLQYVLNAIDVKNLSVFESDQDAMHASLYVVDWEQILGYFNRDGYSFTIYNVTDTDENIATIGSLLARKGYHRSSKIDIYFHYHNDELGKLSGNLKFYFLNLMGGLGYFEDEHFGLAHTLKNIKRSMSVSRKNLTAVKDFCDKPVLIIGNGPSLDSLEEFLKSRAEQFIIISCGTALSTLVKKGIVPDIHVEQERIALVKDVIKEHIPAEVREKLFFVGLNPCSPDVFSLFKKKHMVMKPRDVGVDLIKRVSDSSFYEMYECNPLVSNFGLGVAVMLGFKEIYLAGVDCGMIDSDKHHSKESIYFHEDDQKAPVYRQRAQHSEKGNFRKTIISNPLFNNSRITLESTLNRFKPSCYNLSDGALIRGAEPQQSDSVESFAVIENKFEIVQALFEKCFSNEDFDLQGVASELEAMVDYFNVVCEEMQKNFEIANLSYSEIASQFDTIEALLQKSDKENASVYRLLSGSIRGMMVNIVTAKKVMNESDYSEFYAFIEPEIEKFFVKVKAQLKTSLEF